ncbi:MAG TPA: hypothetical protein VMM36_11950 [Opitutaceae bacterium]|nr:hypothetical protein [Opitutaceae bacterium]
MPLSGTIAWSVVGVAALFLKPFAISMTLFACVGAIAYLGMFLSKFTGENFLDKTRPRNEFDRLFFSAVAQALLVFAIAIPFFNHDYTSLPLSVGILTGLMWFPVSWIIGHWIGIFHAVARTALVLAVWLAFPESRFLAVPIVIVAIYAVTIVVLEARWRAFQSAG